MPVEYQALYETSRWRRIRRLHLQSSPLCEKCQEKGLVVAAEAVHHVVPHKGNRFLFFTGKLQSLCKRCHDGFTQQKERYGFINDIGSDGWPIDRNHPAYNTRKY